MSAVQSILLHLDASPQAEARLRAAMGLAARHGAELMALYGVVPRASLFAIADGMSAQLMQEMLAREEQQCAAARSLFEQTVAGELERARWLDPIQDLSIREFARHAFYADLVVLGQRRRDGPADDGVPGDFVESMLIDSGKPALVVPYIGAQGSTGQTVMVAWKETRETARAVAAALPLLQKAQHVHVATWGDENAVERRRMPDLLAYLGRHGVQAVPHHYGEESGNVGEYILSAVADLDADLLVMGGYGHSRAREWILGGATRTILESMTIPVLMSH